MQLTDNSSINWSERIKSDSRNVDLLGIWSQHLRIQSDFTPAITSVTNRIRYYTLIAYYFQYLSDLNRYDFERIFILSCLAHHDGDFSQLDGVHNKTKFRNDWDNKSEFTLRFKITGQGWSYYVRQLEVLRCAWRDEYGVSHFSQINKTLAESLKNVSPFLFTKKKYTKKDLKEIGDNGLCICNTKTNDFEKEVMSKLLFGFFTKNGEKWQIDIESYKKFKNGMIDLDFEGYDKAVFNDDLVIGKNLKRRNTLFLFLKIIKETSPPNNREFKRFIWDAIYFLQKRNNSNPINFGRLDSIRRYWEFLQLNVYYIFTIEMYLDLINDIVHNKQPINTDELFESFDYDYIRQYLTEINGIDINTQYSITNLADDVNQINKFKRSKLTSPINESRIFDKLKETNTEEKLANITLMLALLYNRYNEIGKKVKDYKTELNLTEFYSLNIHDIFNLINEKGASLNLKEFYIHIGKLIIKKHLYESTIRFHDSNTKNWLFLEEDDCLYSEGKWVGFDSRDNRWGSIRSLLQDLDFIDIEDQIKLTKKGMEWLTIIE